MSSGSGIQTLECVIEDEREQDPTHMSPIKRNWVFSFLWINFAVVLVVLILIAGNQISSGRELLHLVWSKNSNALK